MQETFTTTETILLSRSVILLFAYVQRVFVFSILLCGAVKDVVGILTYILREYIVFKKTNTALMMMMILLWRNNYKKRHF